MSFENANSILVGLQDGRRVRRRKDYRRQNDPITDDLLVVIERS